MGRFALRSAVVFAVVASLALAPAASGWAAPGISGAQVDTNINVKGPCKDKEKLKQNPRLKQLCKDSKASEQASEAEKKAESKLDAFITQQVEEGDGPVYNYLYAALEPLVGSYVAYATSLAYSIAYSYIPGY